MGRRPARGGGGLRVSAADAGREGPADRQPRHIASADCGAGARGDRAERAQALTDVSKGLAETRADSLPEMIALAAAQATNAYQQNKYDEAIPPLLEAMDASRRAGQEELSLTSILAGIYALQGKLAEAQQTLAPIMARPDPNKDLMANVLLFALTPIGAALRNEKRFAEAEPYLVKLVPLVSSRLAKRRTRRASTPSCLPTSTPPRAIRGIRTRVRAAARDASSRRRA